MAMRAGSRAATKPETTNIAILVWIIIGGAVFYYAYHSGVSNQAYDGQSRTSGAKQRRDYVRSQLKECQGKTNKADGRSLSLKDEGVQLWKENRRLEEDNERLVKMNEELEKRSMECAENSEQQKQAWTDEDRRHAGVLTKLEKRNKELLLRSKRLSNVAGMKMILLESNERKLGQENLLLREKLGLPAQEQNAEYVKSLVGKWDKSLQYRRRIVFDPNRTEFSQILKKPQLDWKYSEDQHAARIFFMTRSNDGTYTRPSWNGRVGTQPLAHGVQTSNAPWKKNLAGLLKTLIDYSLCAVGNNITRIMFPTHFTEEAGSIKELSMTDFVDTPLVLFCDDCRPQHHTEPFKLLCQGYTTREQYGTFMYWRTRSRISFANKYLQEADRWIAEQGLEPQSTLAVHLPRGRKVASWCTNRWRKGGSRVSLTYRRLLKGKVEELASTEEECLPSLDNMAEGIQKVAKKAGATDVFVVGVTDGEEWAELAGKLGEGGLKAHRLAPPSTAITVQNVAIASKMGHLLVPRVNRCELTPFLTEQFILNHRIGVEKITVW
eukprot:Hpha_TRINITY_DN15498_c2_g2::TRINITY_DN15498_c2_g2_i1::g.173050::m.173050